MTYALPKELAEQFSISLKTVYNYIKRHPKKIHTKKEFQKTFVNIEDFTRVLHNSFTPFNPVTKDSVKASATDSFWKESESTLKLQKEYKLALQRTEDLEKRNLSLEDKASKYALYFKQEKEEKKERQGKYEALNNKHFETIESFSKERLWRSKKFFIMLWITIALAIWIFFVLLPNITKFLQNL